MHLDKFYIKKMFFWLKLLGAVLFLYLGLVYKVGFVGESITDYISKDYLDQEINQKEVE
jgi:hypothetical protein